MSYKKLIIDALVFRKNIAFGYQEYLFNLLNYFYRNIDLISADEIIIVCDKSQLDSFSSFADRFQLKGYSTPNLLIRFVIQTLYPYTMNLHKDDMVLYTGNFTSFFKKCQYLLVIHDLLFLRKHLLPNFLMRLQRKIYIPRSLSVANKVIAISDFTRNDILQNYNFVPRDKVVMIYNYFNFEKYIADSQENTQRMNRKFFLCVSSLLIHKNIMTIIKAFTLFCRSNNDVDLVLVGSRKKDSSLDEYILQLDLNIQKRIRFLSNISNRELSQLYESCEAYLSATLFEGLGMPVIEAMYFNAPLILSDIAVFREIANDKAVFFDPNSPEYLSDIMLNFKKKSKETRAYVLSKFSETETSQKYIDLINGIFVE